MQFNKTQNVIIDAAVFHAALHGATVAAAVNDIRYYLNGVNLRFSTDRVHVAGTDGHRIFYAAIPAFVSSSMQGKDVILSLDGAKELVKRVRVKKGEQSPALRLRAGIQQGNSLCQFLVERKEEGDKGPEKVMSFGLIADHDADDNTVDGRYPEYSRLLPKGDRESPGEHFLNATYLADATKALRFFLNNAKIMELDTGLRQDLIVFRPGGNTPFHSNEETRPEEVLYGVMPVRM